MSFLQLSFWEADAKRAAAMHGRRVDLLQPLLQQLNTAVYLHLHKVRTRRSSDVDAKASVRALLRRPFALLRCRVTPRGPCGMLSPLL